MHLLDGSMKVLFEEFAENIHEHAGSRILHKDNTEAGVRRAADIQRRHGSNGLETYRRGNPKTLALEKSLLSAIDFFGINPDIAQANIGPPRSYLGAVI